MKEAIMTTTTELTHEQVDAAISAEQEAVNTAIAKVTDAEWTTLTRNDGWTIHDMVGHIADSVFSLNYLLTHGMPTDAPPLDIDANNTKNRAASLGKSRAEIEGRVAAAFAGAHQALVGAELEKPGPFPNMSIGQVFLFIPGHTVGHREELERILAAR